MPTDTEIAVPEFEPWSKYPDLTKERLSIVADVIRRVRHEAVLAHEAIKGDTNWSLGCRVYERTCFSFRNEAPKYADWFSILPEAKPLQFSFAIGAVPFRFYRGTPSDPPDRYTIYTYGELHHQQWCLAIEGLRPPDNVLRLAIETSPMTLEVETVSVVEVDTAGNPIATYVIPAKQKPAQVVSVMQAKPVELAPPQVEPIDDIDEMTGLEGQNADRRKAKAAKTDIKS